jgi:hypothetical protein
MAAGMSEKRRQSQGEQILALLLESGLVFVLFQVIFLCSFTWISNKHSHRRVFISHLILSLKPQPLERPVQQETMQGESIQLGI